VAVDLERELEIAIALARRAGQEAMRYYGGPLEVAHKGEIEEPVTQADTAANEIVVRGLLENFPDDGILSEETADTARRLGRSRVWMVDPLDGTSGFIARDDDFAVHIGLSIDGAPALGVVYRPAVDVLYWAVCGQGAWRQRAEEEATRLQVSDVSDLREARLAASRTHRSPRLDRVIQALGIKTETRRGSVGVKIGLIVERECDLYIHLSSRSKQWDTCAPEAILREAGGELTDLWGYPLRYNTPDVWNRNGLVASNGRLHKAVIEGLQPLLAEFGRTRVA
jgi:3'(2'), 5'-bisphosphate nucleotidase